MNEKSTTKSFAAGVIERGRDEMLIALPEATKADPRFWQFPRCPISQGDAPEKTLRQFARQALGIDIKITVGQPPFTGEIDDEEVELRYMIARCEASDSITPGPYAELRWVSRVHLLEYELDAVSNPVAEWLLSE